MSTMPSRFAFPDMASKLRELITAGMLYSVGDREGKARAILEQYRDDIGGHYARLAEAYLADGQAAAE